MSKLNVVVVGGGQGGANLVRTLLPKLNRSKYNLILIDKRQVLIHIIAGARLSVTSEGDVEDALVSPDRIFSGGYGEYIQGKVTAIEKKAGSKGGHVILENGDRIPFAVLVLGTGSVWEGTVNFPDNIEEIHAFINDNQTRIKQAKNVAIVGAGAVGLELAGEIRDAYSEKKITVVQGAELPLNDTYPVKYRKAVLAAFKARKIDLVLNEFIDEPFTPGATSIKTRSGKSIKADLVLYARGPKPNTDYISSSLGGDTINERGAVKVKRTLQLVSYADIFALGDITDIPEQKQSMKAQQHAGIIAQNVIAYLDGQALKEYKGMMEMIVLTNGKNGGRAYMPVLWGLVFGDWFARMVKAKTLFIPVYRKVLGY